MYYDLHFSIYTYIYTKLTLIQVALMEKFIYTGVHISEVV